MRKLLSKPSISQYTKRTLLASSRLFTFLAAPLLLLLLAEMLLRSFGFGASTTYLQHRTIEGRALVIPNLNYFQQFFGIATKNIAQPEYVDFSVITPKPDGLTRIVVFGESAVYGSPVPEFSFSRYLQVMLEHAYPAHPFEVINAGFPGINSYVIHPMARALLDIEPDFYIVYMGNNEGNAPYALRSFMGRYALLSQPAVVRLHMQLLDLRLTQLVRQLGGTVRDPHAEQFTYDNFTTGPQIAMQRYRTNLREILEGATSSGIPVLLCTLGRNLYAGLPAAPPNPPVTAEAIPNPIIREVAQGFVGKGVTLVDLAQGLRQCKNGKAPDFTEFFDPVHFTPQGNFNVAALLLDQLAATIPFEPASPFRPHAREMADRALALSPEYEQFLVASYSEDKSAAEVRPQEYPQEAAARDIILMQEAASARPHDTWIRARLVRALRAQGRVEEACDAALALARDYPWRHGVWSLLASCQDGSEQRQTLERERAHRPGYVP